MGLLVDGTWHDTWYDTKSTGGAFKRSAAQFRNWITADGSVRGRPAKAGSRQNPGAITSMSATPAPGRIAR